MKNIKKNLIFFALILFTFIAFNSMPKNANAYYYVGFVGENYIGCETTLDSNGAFIGCGINPTPSAYSILPNTKNLNSDTNAYIIVTGTNFMPNSVISFKNSDRATTYVNSGTLKFQMSASDVSSAGNFPLRVTNPGPGGGVSNAIIFNVSNPKTVVTGTTTNSNKSNTNSTTSSTTTNQTNNTLNSNSSNENSKYGLTSNALFASNGFLPSSFLQWIIVFMLIIFIIALWRKLLPPEKYRAQPLKHA